MVHVEAVEMEHFAVEEMQPKTSFLSQLNVMRLRQNLVNHKFIKNLDKRRTFLIMCWFFYNNLLSAFIFNSCDVAPSNLNDLLKSNRVIILVIIDQLIEMNFDCPAILCIDLAETFCFKQSADDDQNKHVLVQVAQ